MATLLLWQFDKYLKKNRLCGYNGTLITKVNKLKLEKLELKKAQEEEMKLQESQQEQKISLNESPDKEA